MARIAILGSCITRDLWPVREAAPRDLLYVARTSLSSLLARPVTGFEPAAEPPGPLRPQQHRALVADLLKTALPQLVAFRPTHLIFDFIDERFDLLAGDATLITRSWELEASGYLEQPALRGFNRVPRLSSGCERLWTAAAAELAALVRATPLRDARLILHSAQWAETVRGPSGPQPLGEAEIAGGERADVAEHNALLARYEAAFLRVMPPMAVVAAPEQRIADPDHRWGLSPFHYVPAYYEAVWAELEPLGVSRLDARSAAPSAPAA